MNGEKRTYPFARTCRGKISGPYTHGIQLTEAPKISMNRKKKATDAVAVGFSTDVPMQFNVLRPSRLCWKAIPLNESRIEIIIIEMNSPKDPHIIGLRRPNRSEKNVG